MSATGFAGHYWTPAISVTWPETWWTLMPSHFAKRIHYRKAIFINYVRCIIAHADSLYRHLTRDSLAAAKLQYIRALFLMGKAPEAKAMSYWEPASVDHILGVRDDGNYSLLETFSRTLNIHVPDLPARIHGTPDFSILKRDVFRPVANDDVLGIWKYIDNCLDNMRNGMTLDGKPMSLPLYAPLTHPMKLLQAQAGGSSGSSRNAGGWRNIPHYRSVSCCQRHKTRSRHLSALGVKSGSAWRRGIEVSRRSCNKST